MRSLTLTTAVALALTAAACGQSDDNQITTDNSLANDLAANDVLGPNTTASADGAGAAAPTDAHGFAHALAAANLYEIEAGKLAAAKGVSAEVKALGGQLQADHKKNNDDLIAAATAANVALSPALDAEKKAMLDLIKAASGAEFDKTFVAQQKAAHEKTLALLKAYSAGGDNQALKGFAAKTETAVKGHLDHISRIKL